MKNNLSRVVRSGFMALLIAASTGLVQAATQPLPPNSNAFGVGYDELAAGWMEWAFGIPVATNPLLDPTGAYGAIGQSGKVWYLSATFGTSATRTLTVPAGTALFLPIVVSLWMNAPELGDAPWSPAQEQVAYDYVRAEADTFASLDLVLEIDGRAVTGLQRFRAASTVGMCVLPEDNVFAVFGYEAGPHECVSDGYWALLPPLTAGTHTVRFGALAADGSLMGVDYNLTIRPRPEVKAVGMKPHP
jgi:hypothetical protein